MDTIVYEAESNVNTQYETKVFSQEFCSNGKCVGWIGYGRYLKFNQVYAQNSDTYRMYVDYISGENRTLYVCINENIYLKTVVFGSSINRVDTTFIDIPLKKGNNTIRFYNEDGWAPDIDCIKIEDIDKQNICVSNLNDEETITYRYLIIKGSVDNFNENSISVETNGENLNWKVHTNKKIFKAIVKLKPGDNTIKISYADHKSKFLLIRYEPKIEGPGIKFTYMISKDDQGDFRAPNGENHSISSAQSRYTNLIYLVQSIFAELMYDRGFGRQTFRVILPYDNEYNAVFVQRATKTYSELCQYNSLENSGYTYYDLFDYVRSIVDDTKPYHIKDVVMLSCSHYIPDPLPNDPNHKITYADTALSSEYDNMALVGATTLYTVPENFEDIPSRLYDTTNGYMQDNTYWESFNVSMGGILHEIGHMLGLEHYYEEKDGKAFIDWNTEKLVGDNGRDGIMGWGMYQTIHPLVIYEGNGADFDPQRDSACWNWAYTSKDNNGKFIGEQNDCMVLSANPWVSDVPYFKREAESKYNILSPSDNITPTIYRNRTCSGWNIVGMIRNGSSISFENIYVDQEGIFKVKIYYRSDETRYAYITTNYNIRPVNLITFPAMPDLNTIGTVEVLNIYLVAGLNAIRLVTNGVTLVCAPDIDKIEIERDNQ